MTKYITITTAFNKKAEAERVINTLLEEHLVSCAQLTNIDSKYHWQNKIEHEKEYLVSFKTKKALYPVIEEKILSLHSYEVPEIVATDITIGYDKYLDWIDQETKNVSNL